MFYSTSLELKILLFKYYTSKYQSTSTIVLGIYNSTSMLLGITIHVEQF